MSAQCFKGVAKVFLVVINLIFMKLSLVMVVCGFILRYGKSIYEPYLEVGTSLLKTAVKATNLGNFDHLDFDLGSAMASIALGLILGGLALLAISGTGCCGASYQSTCLLWIYITVILVFITGEGAALGILYGEPEIAKEKLKSDMSTYGGLSASDVYSLTWNIVMIQFKCCGVDDYHDFSKYATNWERTPGDSVTLVTPLACCKTLPLSGGAEGMACATSYSAATNNGEIGCFQTLWDLSLGNTANVLPVLIVCGVIQLSLIVFAITIILANRNKYDPVRRRWYVHRRAMFNVAVTGEMGLMAFLTSLTPDFAELLFAVIAV